jgi:hypothetical protein
MSNAMSGGKQAARNIDTSLMGDADHSGDRWASLFPDFEYSRQAPGEPSLSSRHQAQSLPAETRAHSQQEVVAGLSEQEALEECRRCLRCDLKISVGAN